MTLELAYFSGSISILTILYVIYLVIKVKQFEEGEPRIAEISSFIRAGAMSFLSRQYLVVSIFLLAMFLVLIGLVFADFLSVYAPYAFLTAGFFSGLAGYVGMRIATFSNGRTTYAAKESLNQALRLAFDSGSVMGFSVVGMGLFYIIVWFVALDAANVPTRTITEVLLTSAMGASSVALFARVGGGIYTKAADVGADLAGKVEAGIPEDDPRNPAVIADNVGDNVGDVAGMGADLYESYVGSIVAAMALGVIAFQAQELEGFFSAGVLFPTVLAAIGIIASIGGTFFVRAGEEATQKTLLRALRRGVYVAAGLVAIGAFLAVWQLFGFDYIGIFLALLFGLIAGIIIGYFTEYYTSHSYLPTQRVSESARTGPATVIINGLSTGMLSTAIPVTTIALAIIGSYLVASSTGPDGGELGLYGIGVAAVGMLSTLGITLSSDAYGPVADNAGGIAEMSQQEDIVRQRTDALDALGNTNAATGKGFAIGSAALTSLALITNFNSSIRQTLENSAEPITTYLGDRVLKLATLQFDLSEPRVLLGLFIGGMLPFLFSSFTMKSVGRAAEKIVEEVRRQFREIDGLMEGKANADYQQAVNISTRTAHHEMIAPALLAIISPIVIGLIFGIEAMMGLLVGALVSGFVLAVLMANAGGSWDNAKKSIEEGRLGGKGSEAHKASVVGDTVGDPFKDTAGPSLNILIKLMSMVSLVFVTFIIHHILF
ncbi:MAG: sodium-translocating pyrophosphatase [Candidatus Bipolaricaulia bacterium]